MKFLLLLLAGVVLIGGASALTQYYEDFEDDTPGSNPTETWYAFGEHNAASASVVNTLAASGTNSLRVNGDRVAWFDTGGLFDFCTSGASIDFDFAGVFPTSSFAAIVAMTEVTPPNDDGYGVAPIDDFMGAIQGNVATNDKPRLAGATGTFGSNQAFGVANSLTNNIWYHMRLDQADCAAKEFRGTLSGGNLGLTQYQVDWVCTCDTGTFDVLDIIGAGRYGAGTISTQYVYMDNLRLNTPEIETAGAFSNDRFLSSLWVDLENPPHVYTRETNDGNFLGGNGLIYALNADLTVNTSRNPCTTFAFPSRAELAGIGYAPYGQQIGGHCNSLGSTDQYEFFALNADPSNGTLLADVNRGTVISNEDVNADCQPTSNDWWVIPAYILLGLEYTRCDGVGAYEPAPRLQAGEWGGAWGSQYVGYDLTNGELQEIWWTQAGPVAVEQDTTLATDPSVSQLAVDMRTGFYAYVDTTNGLTIRKGLQDPPLLVSPSTTGKALALTLCELGCPFGAPPAQTDNESYVWIIDGTNLERHSYNFATNTLTFQTSTSTAANQIRLSWNRQYLLAWQSSGTTITLYNSTGAMEVQAAFAASNPLGVATAHMDVANNYIFALTGGSVSGKDVERFNAYNVTHGTFGDGAPGSPHPGGPGGSALCAQLGLSCGPDSAAGDQCCAGDEGTIRSDSFDGGFLRDPIVPGNPDFADIATYVSPDATEETVRWMFGIALILTVTAGVMIATRWRGSASMGMGAGWVLALMFGLVPIWSIAIGGTLAMGLYAARGR